MSERAMTPREAYEKYMNGEPVETGKKANVAFAKRLLRRQAGQLCTEKCVKEVLFRDEDANPWSVCVKFADGELSHDGQTILNAMRSNAHRTEMGEYSGMTQISFYVYCMEED